MSTATQKAVKQGPRIHPQPSSPFVHLEGTWQLTLSDGTSLADPQVVASGMPMEEPIRFVACMVEHSRSNDAEFQVLNKAAEATAAKTGQLEERRSQPCRWE